MYSRPSTDVIVAPCALRKKTGVPPTPLNARTGLCTPPGEIRTARSKYSRERSSGTIAACCEAILPSDAQLPRITRAVGDHVLRAGAFEYVPGLEQSFFELD